MRRACRGYARNAGFTLIEMLAAIAIVALVAGVAVPLLRPPPQGLQLEAAARALCAALRLTRTRAIATNQEIALVVDVERKSYRSPVIAETILPRAAGVELTVADARRESPQIGDFLFFPGGGSTGGDVTLLLGGRRATINVNWLTGDARCDIT